MKIIWKDVPTGLRLFVEPSIQKWERFLPRWLESLEVVYLPEEDSLASMRILPHYRQALLCLHGKTLQDDDIENTILHEFVHVSFEPVRRIFHRTLSRYLEDYEASTGFTEECFEDAMEGMVCDISYGIQRILKHDPTHP